MSGIFKAYDIRGVYPEQLDENIAERIGRAVVVFLKAKKIVVGRDMRPHSLPLFNALAKGITEQGADVIDLGMCSTPMSYHANGKLGADAGVMITASLNTAEWNGFKICREQAIPISGATGIADIEALGAKNEWPQPERTGTISAYDIAKEYGIRLYTENLLDGDLTVRCGTLVQFVNEVGRNNLDIVFDIGHCQQTGGNVPDEVLACGKLLRHLHLHDTIGGAQSHLPIGDGEIDYPAFAAALRKIGYQGIYMLELRRCTPENLIRSRERLIQCL